jgi:glyoxylase-like metal-dependent hydrolase (beta-lactamase superfamily II)
MAIRRREGGERTNLLLSSSAGPAHTDGDISVLFSEANILHVGDTYWNGIYPFIDYSTGGSINGKIKACETSLAMAREDTITIPRPWQSRSATRPS